MTRTDHARTLRAAIIFGACSAFANAEPINVTSVEPQFVQVKRAEQVQIGLANATAETQVSVHPGGPYIFARTALTGTGTALSVDDNGTSWVGTASGEIHAYQANLETGFSLLSKKSAGAGITALAAHPPWLYATTADGYLVAFDIQSPAAPRETARLPLGGTAISMAAQSDRICAVLESNTLVEIGLGDPTQPAIAARHPYPNRVLSVAAHDGACVIGTAQNGIIGYQHDTPSAYPAHGPVHALQHNGEHWLSVDGVNGLSLFDRATNGSMEWIGSFNRIENARLLASESDAALVADESGVLSLIDTHNTDLPALVTEFRLPHIATAIGLHRRLGYALSDNELVAIDFSADAAPPIGPLGVNLGGSRRSVVDAGLLYVADWFSGLHIYDIANPRNLHHLTTVHTTGSPKGVLVQNHMAFVADDDQGLQILDVANPLRPQTIAHLPLPGLAYTMKRVGDLLYLASHRGGLHIINIANPRKPKLVGSFDTPGKAWAVDILDHYAYIADDSSGVLVLDIANPSQPRLVGEFNPGGTAEDLVIRNGLAYVAFFDRGLFILDLSQRTEPRAVSHLDIAGNARGIVLRDQIAFVSAWQAGVIAVDIGTPAAPIKLGQFDTAGAVWGLSVAGNEAYVMDWWGGVRVADISDPRSMKPVSQYQAGLDVARLALQRNYLFAAGSDQGLHVFDAKNTLNPVWTHAVELSGSAQDIAPAGDYAFVAAGRGGLAVVDITAPMEARLVTQLPLAHRADRIATTANRAAVAERDGHLTLVDTRLPALPQRLKVHSLQTRDIGASQDAFIIATRDRGLLRLASTMGSPIELDSRRDIRLVRVAEQGIFTVDDQGNLTLFELQEQRLVSRARLAITANIVDMSIRDNLIYLASADDGLWVIEYGQNALRLSAHYPSAHLATSLAINNAGVFLGGPNGISSGELLPAIEIQRTGSNSATLSIPVTMPMGVYDIALHTPGQPNALKRNAFKIGIGKAKKSSFTLEDLKRVLKQPQFEGQAPK